MNRRDCLGALLALGAAVRARGSGAQEKVRRIGLLFVSSPKTGQRNLDAFRAGMKERGWVEGRNLALEIRWAEGRLERVPEMAQELVRLRPDVIVAGANRVIAEIKKVTSSIPIVMSAGADPVEWGLVASLARPGGNLTGVTSFYEATPIKMLELAAGLVPRGARVAALLESGSPMSRRQPRSELERAARILELKLDVAEANAGEPLVEAVKALGARRPSALIVLPGAALYALGGKLVQAAEALKVPVIYPFEEMVEAGGLMSYAVSIAEGNRRAAHFVDRILRGANPGELPIEQPTQLSLAINLKTAGVQGIRIPQEMLFKANRVIE